MKIIELDLYTSDLEATKRFYVSRLCLPMVSQSTTHLTVLVGWTRLTFRLVHQPVAPYHLAINVPHDSLEVLMYYYDLDFLSTQAPGKLSPTFPPGKHVPAISTTPRVICWNLLPVPISI